MVDVAARGSERLLWKYCEVKCGNHKHHAPVRTRAELLGTDAAGPVPKSHQSAVYYRETISKNGEDFGGGHVGGGGCDWALGA